MVADFNLQLGTLGEWAAALAGGAALIFALLGWRIATAANRDQATFIRAELERHRIELEDRDSRLQHEAALVEFNVLWTNVQRDGSMRVEADHEALAFHNGSGRPLRWLDIELTDAAGERIEGWLHFNVAPGYRAMTHLSSDATSWNARFEDLSGRFWLCDRQDPLPRPGPPMQRPTNPVP